MARVLVVDDEESIRDLVRMLLEREGHAVTDAPGGREALDLLRDRPFDLVLLDRSMPLMSGMEVLRAIRADGALAGTKVLMVTAAGLMSDADEALSAGADDYLVKPLDAKLLVEKTARLSAGAAPSSGLISRLRRLLP